MSQMHRDDTAITSPGSCFSCISLSVKKCQCNLLYLVLSSLTIVIWYFVFCERARWPSGRSGSTRFGLKNKLKIVWVRPDSLKFGVQFFSYFD